jgi:hypothetical protein
MSGKTGERFICCFRYPEKWHQGALPERPVRLP